MRPAADELFLKCSSAYAFDELRNHPNGRQM